MIPIQYKHKIEAVGSRSNGLGARVYTAVVGGWPERTVRGGDGSDVEGVGAPVLPVPGKDDDDMCGDEAGMLARR